MRGLDAVVVRVGQATHDHAKDFGATGLGRRRIAEELAPSGISVTCLCPGPTETEFAQVAGMKSVRLPNLDVADAADVAEFGYRAMRAGSRVAVPGARNKLVVQAQRFVPRRLIARAMERMQRRRL